MEGDKNLTFRLNNYGYSPEVVNKDLENRTSGKIPDYVKDTRRYQDKWKPFYVSQDGQLMYRPNKLKLLIDPEEKEKVLKEMFNNDRYGVGAGVSAFSRFLCRKYLKIQIIEVG